MFYLKNEEIINFPYKIIYLFENVAYYSLIIN